MYKKKGKNAYKFLLPQKPGKKDCINSNLFT